MIRILEWLKGLFFKNEVEYRYKPSFIKFLWPGINLRLGSVNGVSEIYICNDFDAEEESVGFVYKGSKCKLQVTRQAFDDGVYGEQIERGIKNSILPVDAYYNVLWC